MPAPPTTPTSRCLPGTAPSCWSRRGTLLTAVGAGVAIGLAILSRQSWLLGVVPACVSVGLHGRWRNVVPFLAAAAATVATTGFYAPLGRFWEWNVTNSPGFVFAGTGIWAALGRGAASLLGFAAFHPVVIGAVGVSAVAGGRRHQAAVAARPTSTCGCGLPPGVAAWAAGLRFFGHYWLQVLPPLVLLAVPVVARLDRACPSAAVIAGLAVPALAAWILLFVPGSFHHRPDPTDLADYVTIALRPSADRVLRVGLVPRGAGRRRATPGRRFRAHRLRRRPFRWSQRPGARRSPSATPGAAEIMLDSLDRAPAAADPRHLDGTEPRLRAAIRRPWCPSSTGSSTTAISASRAWMASTSGSADSESKVTPPAPFCLSWLQWKAAGRGIGFPPRRSVI